jgi:hypothetical protein
MSIPLQQIGTNPTKKPFTSNSPSEWFSNSTDAVVAPYGKVQTVFYICSMESMLNQVSSVNRKEQLTTSWEMLHVGELNLPADCLAPSQIVRFVEVELIPRGRKIITELLTPIFADHFELNRLAFDDYIRIESTWNPCCVTSIGRSAFDGCAPVIRSLKLLPAFFQAIRFSSTSAGLIINIRAYGVPLLESLALRRHRERHNGELRQLPITFHLDPQDIVLRDPHIRSSDHILLEDPLAQEEDDRRLANSPPDVLEAFTVPSDVLGQATEGITVYVPPPVNSPLRIIQAQDMDFSAISEMETSTPNPRT